MLWSGILIQETSHFVLKVTDCLTEEFFTVLQFVPDSHSNRLGSSQLVPAAVRIHFFTFSTFAFFLSSVALSTGWNKHIHKSYDVFAYISLVLQFHSADRKKLQSNSVFPPVHKNSVLVQSNAQIMWYFTWCISYCSFQAEQWQLTSSCDQQRLICLAALAEAVAVDMGTAPCSLRYTPFTLMCHSWNNRHGYSHSLSQPQQQSVTQLVSQLH